jgi:putative transposase
LGDGGHCRHLAGHAPSGRAHRSGKGSGNAQLADFIVYKARRVKVPLVFVDPAYYSKECAQCGHVDRLNRISQAKFACRWCGVVAHADRNASRVLAHRGEDAWTVGRESRVPDTP